MGDSCDNAPIELIDGLFEAVEYAPLAWVDRFNSVELLMPIGNIPPAEAQANHHAAPETSSMAT